VLIQEDQAGPHGLGSFGPRLRGPGIEESLLEIDTRPLRQILINLPQATKFFLAQLLEI